MASLLTKALKGDSGVSDGDKAFQRYAELSGKGEASPLWIKIYYPFADKSSKPLEVPIRRSKAADAGPPAVNDLIGLALFRYDEEQVTPALKPSDKRVKKWELRMVDDGEVEMDFLHSMERSSSQTLQVTTIDLHNDVRVTSHGMNSVSSELKVPMTMMKMILSLHQ